MSLAGTRTPIAAAADALRRARADALLDRAALFHDLEGLRSGLHALTAAFPANALHAVAIKANPVVEVLREVVRAGCGLEAASIEEVELALAAGCAPDRIVYDSPVKTREELDLALTLGVAINADSFEELGRIAELWPRVANRQAYRTIGVRVNPEVDAGTIAATSVGTSRSRFGEAWSDVERFVDAFRRYPWLNTLHCHVGSQGCALETMLEAAARVAALRRRINAALGENRVTSVDIGGGLPVAYTDSDRPPSVADYAAALRTRTPCLFAPRLRLITEFGRAVQAPCGFAASRVEYVHERGGRRIAATHLGADLLLRAAYAPNDWRHEIIVLDADGFEKPTASTQPWTIVGPLCFAGDVIAQDRPLPAIAANDWILVRDVGAYTLSMWSRHCSRAMPPVIGMNADLLRVLRGRESPDDLVAFWSRTPALAGRARTARSAA